VTQLGGDGGVGKSMVGLQLGVATAIDKQWLGMSPRSGPVIYLSAEDDLDELHRRLEAIAASYGVAVADLTDLHLLPMAGLDAVLGAPGERGVISPTEVWRALLRLVERIKPCLVILDTLADVFAGNENARLEVRTFVGMLRGLAIEHDLAVLLLAHPSLSGMASGSGTSGSTGWNNSVRSRLYLENPKGERDREIDPDLRVLSVKKVNYGPPGLQLTLKWYAGGFVREGADGAPGGLDRLTAQARDERIFFDLLKAYNEQGRTVSPNPGANYAPAVFERDEDADGITRAAFTKAMGRLVKAERIHTDPIGPPSKKRAKLAPGPGPAKAQAEGREDAAS
jgi:RecA-family ATPase